MMMNKKGVGGWLVVVFVLILVVGLLVTIWWAFKGRVVIPESSDFLLKVVDGDGVLVAGVDVFVNGSLIKYRGVLERVDFPVNSSVGVNVLDSSERFFNKSVVCGGGGECVVELVRKGTPVINVFGDGVFVSVENGSVEKSLLCFGFDDGIRYVEDVGVVGGVPSDLVLFYDVCYWISEGGNYSFLEGGSDYVVLLRGDFFGVDEVNSTYKTKTI